MQIFLHPSRQCDGEIGETEFKGVLAQPRISCRWKPKHMSPCGAADDKNMDQSGMEHLAFSIYLGPTWSSKP